MSGCLFIKYNNITVCRHIKCVWIMENDTIVMTFRGGFQLEEQVAWYIDFFTMRPHSFFILQSHTAFERVQDKKLTP